MKVEIIRDGSLTKKILIDGTEINLNNVLNYKIDDSYEKTIFTINFSVREIEIKKDNVYKDTKSSIEITKNSITQKVN